MEPQQLQAPERLLVSGGAHKMPYSRACRLRSIEGRIGQQIGDIRNQLPSVKDAKRNEGQWIIRMLLLAQIDWRRRVLKAIRHRTPTAIYPSKRLMKYKDAINKYRVQYEKARQSPVLAPLDSIPDVRRMTFERDGYKCVRCGATDNLSFDHIVPKWRGGLWSMSNGQTLCIPCNNQKGGYTISFLPPQK